MREVSKQCSGFPKVIKEGGDSVHYKMATVVRAPFVTVGTFSSPDTHCSASWSSKLKVTSRMPIQSMFTLYWQKYYQSPDVKAFLCW